MKRFTDKKTAKDLAAKPKLTPNQKIYLALFEKENAEEKLKMSADLLNKVMDAPNGFYVKFKYDKASYIYHVRFDHLTQSRVIWYDIHFYHVDNEFLPSLLTGQNGVWPNEYGKTWAFTREELEDDLTRSSMAEIDAKQKAKREDPMTAFKEEICHFHSSDASKLLSELKAERKRVEKAIKHNNLKYLGAVSGKYGDAVKEVSDLRKQLELLNKKIAILKRF